MFLPIKLIVKIKLSYKNRIQMSEKDKELKNSNYFKKLLPSEISVKKEDIFYRDKYNEIINYVKVLLSDSKDFEFSKFIQPKGTLLINVYPGTDIIEFIKLISSNYYLDYIELNNIENIINSDDFFKNLTETLENDGIYDEKEVSNNNEKRKKLILINEFYRYITDESTSFQNLLIEFIKNFKNNLKIFNFIKKNSILIWLNYNYEEIARVSSELFNIFDLFIKIPILNKFERETVLRNFSEKNPKIVFDINAIVNITENWEVMDLNQLLKVAIFKHFLNIDLNDVSNEITDTVIKLIQTEEFIPSKMVKEREPKITTSTEYRIQDTIMHGTEVKKVDVKNSGEKEAFFKEIRDMGLSEFMLNQLYENAASKNYNELLIIIDKLNKKEPLEDNERKIVARYPFILNDSPNMAQLNIEKAKKRIDLLRKAFGK